MKMSPCLHKGEVVYFLPFVHYIVVHYFLFIIFVIWVNWRPNKITQGPLEGFVSKFAKGIFVDF